MSSTGARFGIVAGVEGEKPSRCEVWVGAECGEQRGDDGVRRTHLRS